MSNEHLPKDERVDPPPSYFANLGSPNCSMWGKAEIEWLALAYVQALAANGDTWKKLSRKEVLQLLSDDQAWGRVQSILTLDIDRYIEWFEIVSEQLTSAQGAQEVWSLSLRTLARLAGIKQ